MPYPKSLQETKTIYVSLIVFTSKGLRFYFEGAPFNGILMKEPGEQADGVPEPCWNPHLFTTLGVSCQFSAYFSLSRGARPATWLCCLQNIRSNHGAPWFRKQLVQP